MEREDLNKKIKSKGYFEVRFLPSSLEDMEITNLLNLIKKNQVSFRGWPYPYISNVDNEHNKKPYHFVGGIEGFTDFDRHKEIWRFYKSGQFVHRFSVKEDWLPNYTDKDDRVLDFVNLIYTFTEMFQLISNLFINKTISSDGGYIIIKLINTKNRRIVAFDPGRDLSREYKTMIDEIEIKDNFNKKEIIEKSDEISMKNIQELFTYFNWDGQPGGVFKKIQEDLRNRNTL